MHNHRLAVVTVGVVVGSLSSALIALAWTGPSSAAPAGNVAAPINVSSTAQVKNGGLSVNALTVFGNGILTGSLAVGSSNVPAYTIDVTGTARMTGNVTALGYFHSSDARLKENITTSAGLSIVRQLRGVTFDWKKDGAHSAGVIAQEIEQVMPSAVHTDASGMKTVEYDQLVAPLIESIKEQQVEIDSLKHDIEILKAAH